MRLGWTSDLPSGRLSSPPCIVSMHRWREETACASSPLVVAATAHPLLPPAATMTQRRLLRQSAAGPSGGGRMAMSSVRLCGTAAACSSTLACRRLFDTPY